MRRLILSVSPLLEPLVLIVLLTLTSAQFKLRVGGEGNDPPSSQMGADGKLAGFDGMVVASVTIPEERKKAVYFEEAGRPRLQPSR